MATEEITDRDRELAQKCVECKLCMSAREKPRSIAYWFVRLLERGICPACKAYKRVYGRPAHEAVPPE